MNKTKLQRLLWYFHWLGSALVNLAQLELEDSVPGIGKKIVGH